MISFKEFILEISSETILRYKKANQNNLKYHSDAWDELAKLPNFSKSQQKSFDHHDKQAEKRYKGIGLSTKRLAKKGIRSK